MDKTQRLGTKNISGLLLEFSIPAIVGMLVSALYNVVDRIFIGNSSGSLGLAGITIAFPIMIIQFAFGVLVGAGATSLISIRLGQGREDDAQKILGNAVVLLAVATVLITAAGSLFIDPLLKLFGASAEVLPYARDYVRIIIFGTVFQTYGFGLNNMMRGEGRPVIAMVTMFIGTVLNCIFAPVFIFAFHWGIQGAALATVCAQAVSTTWIFVYFVRGDSLLKIHPRFLRLHAGVTREILLIGFAPFVMQLAQSALVAVLNFSLVEYGGDVAISAMGVINSISTLIMMPIFGINQGAQPIIGYNYGARQFARVRRTVLYAAVAATCISTAGFALVTLLPTQLISLFNPNDRALIAFGSRAMVIFLFCLPIIGFQVVGAGYFQAAGKPRQSMILSLSRQVLILIPLILILPRFFAVNGVLYAGPVSDFLSFLITIVCLGLEFRSLRREEACGAGPDAVSADASGVDAVCADAAPADSAGEK